MKKKVFCFLMLLVVSVLNFYAYSVTTKKVAVYAIGNLQQCERTIVTDAVIARLSGNQEFRPFERNSQFVKALNKEQDFQLSGEVLEREIRAVGERMGVDYVIVVNVVVNDDKCHMSARIIHLESGEIIKSVNLVRDYTGPDVISTMVNNVAYRLINKKSK